MKQWIKRAAIFISALLLLLVMSLFLGRNSLLRHLADQKISQAEQTYGLTIRYRSLEMPKLTQVQLTGLSMVPAYRDTLLTLDSLQVDLNLFPLLKGHIDIHRVNTNGLSIHFVKRDSTANYDFIFRKNQTDTDTLSAETSVPVDFSQRVKETLNLAFGFLPENGTISRFSISQRRDSTLTSFDIPLLTVKENRFNADIHVTENGERSTWCTKGELNASTRQVKAGIYAARGTSRISIPYIKKYYNATVEFDSLAFSLSQKEMSEQQALTGSASINGLHVYHAGLSPDTIDLNNGQIDYCVRITPRFIELDSASAVTFNQLNFHPYVKAERNPLWHVKASINQPAFSSQQLFSSLPAGLFRHLNGVQTRGELTYNFLLDVDFNELDSLKFYSMMRGKEFRITDFGNSNLTRMNEEFIYTAYEDGQPVRSFAIGPSNPDFRPLDSISPLLQMAIMQSEDGGFFYHNGFLPGAIQEALIHDLKVKRFARGGSTISMQLVKNVFLSRHKNIARKLEEALIVWLIEQQRITSKQRMYEVYLNIVEWGPLIYGAREASRYYFDKEPSQLTANEAIFLASIVPKPKRFRSLFNADATLKEDQEGYFRLIAERLKVKGLLSEEQAEGIRAEIEVKGAAKEAITLTAAPVDSVANIPLYE